MRKIPTLTAVAGLALAVAAAPAQAKHSWGDWHWYRSANPVTLKVLNSTTDTRNVTGNGQNWPALLARSATEWSQSSALDLAVQPQTATDVAAQQACVFATGAIRVCNVYNPDVTWLGLATVLPDTSKGGGHVLAATAQMNDAWFSTPFYSELNAQHVMCQEIGHTFGLGHQSEDGSDLNTCMDYAEALDNPSPNAHDYQQIDTIYTHLDGASSGGGGGNGGGNGGGKPPKDGGGGKSAWSPESLGFLPGYHGTHAAGEAGHAHSDVFETVEDGRKVVRFVTWAY